MSLANYCFLLYRHLKLTLLKQFERLRFFKRNCKYRFENELRKSAMSSVQKEKR